MTQKIFTLCFVCFSTVHLYAQHYVHQVIFLNEGWFDFVNHELVVSPSLGTYDPATKSYHVFDEIPEANFGSDVLIDDVIYVAADQYLITYDKNTFERLAQISVPGIRNLAIWNDHLLVTRGDYLVFFDSYFYVYDKHTLELLYTLDTEHGPQYASGGIVVRDDTAYVAINNGFVFGEEVGIIGIVDLNNRTYAGEIDMGPDARNPDNIMLDENRIYTLNNKDYSGSSITAFEPESRTTVVYDKIAANAGCGTSTFAAGHVYYMEYGVDKLARFDVQKGHIVDTLSQTSAYYGLIDDPINTRLYATWTDFVSQGIAEILDYEGNVLHTFDVGVSPGSIALDVRVSTGIDRNLPSIPEIVVYPNPVHGNTFSITAESVIDEVRIYDLPGRLIHVSRPDSKVAKLYIPGLANGTYLASASLLDGTQAIQRVVVIE